ncbi:HNH endonuclease [Stutzerimonas nitrititolerans]|uniref:HNH endonuclease n=1 Tax=Stutzerimonas nitrititolerans TaxID=2482751 RepID=UPI00289E72B2|nr:HNH endonuclease [Stutzerimonas nitrititolerans]
MGRLKTLPARLQTVGSRSIAKAGVDESDGWGSGRGGRPWRRKRDAILLRDKYTCQVCGHIGADLEVDHIINLAQDGTDDESNLQALCIPCHKEKTQRESQQGRR